MQDYHQPLKTGILQLQLENSSSPSESLFDFAARNNPKRGFLFVSKVLGKHIPSRPADMTATQRQLAEQLLANDNQCDLFIGMAETATGLGQGVYEQYLQLCQPEPEPLYCNTTRYPVSGLQQIPFEESHSHATALHLYVPEEPVLKQRFQQARHVVLIDDEISTGNTFLNLIRALRHQNPQIQTISIVSILNFVGEEKRQILHTQIGLPVSFCALLNGSFSFTPDPDFVFKTQPSAESNIQCRRSNLSLSMGRTGTRGALQLNCDAVDALVKNWSQKASILVLGTGEFMHPAYGLGCHLETLGFNRVWIQSTTRSPILPGECIQAQEALIDSYGDGIPNYLYNVKPGQYEHVFICHETAKDTYLNTLSQRLDAITLQFDAGKIFIS